MSNRPTKIKLSEAKQRLTLNIKEEFYHDLWTLIHEIEALQNENDELRKVRKY